MISGPMRSWTGSDQGLERLQLLLAHIDARALETGFGVELDEAQFLEAGGFEKLGGSSFGGDELNAGGGAG